MKLLSIKIAALAALACLTAGCSDDSRHAKHQDVKMHEYAYRPSPNSDDWLYYYLIFSNSTNTYVYTESPTRLTDFSQAKFITTSSSPVPSSGVVQERSIEVPTSNFSPEAVAEIEAEAPSQVVTEEAVAPSNAEEHGTAVSHEDSHGFGEQSEAGSGSPSESPDSGSSDSGSSSSE